MPEPGAGVVLVGLPASGKTTVGRIVARLLDRPFVDTDDLVSRRTGLPAPTYLAANGEAAFRAEERAALDEACAMPDAIVATGGGALNDPLNRWRLWQHGRALWLDAPQPVLLRRLDADSNPRPLLAANPGERLAGLARARDPFYRAADARIDASSRPDVVAGAILGALRAPIAGGRRLFDALEPRHHPIGPERARVVIGTDLAPVLREALREIGGVPAAVVDRRVAWPGAGAFSRRLAIAGGERAKRTRSLERIVAWMAAQGLERGDPLVGIGGGTVGDVVGLAAGLYARGVPYVAVPTTWLAQLDAAIGGKVAIDLPAGKNLIGAFWPAWAVVADVGALRTLPRARLRDGLAEAVKAGMIGDPVLWQLVAEHGREALDGDEAVRFAITERAARVKLEIVGRDPFEGGERRLLNLGHTIGHALEAESGFRLEHGTAVALGMRAASSLAERRGGDRAHAAQLDEVLGSLGFPLRHRFDPAVVRAKLGADKKRVAGRQRWLLPMAVGHVTEAIDITDQELNRALATIAED